VGPIHQGLATGMTTRLGTRTGALTDTWTYGGGQRTSSPLYSRRMRAKASASRAGRRTRISLASWEGHLPGTASAGTAQYTTPLVTPYAHTLIHSYTHTLSYTLIRLTLIHSCTHFTIHSSHHTLDTLVTPQVLERRWPLEHDPLPVWQRPLSKAWSPADGVLHLYILSR
jgi:hypothetical protein